MARAPRRPTKTENGGWTPLTPERQAAIVANIGKGVHIETACRAAGVTSPSYRRWMAAGADRTVVDETTGEESIVPGIEPYRAFRAAVEQAEGELELALVERYCEQATLGNAAHLAGFLGRRFRTRWSPNAQVEVSGPVGLPRMAMGDDVDRLAGTLEALARAGLVVLPDGPLGSHASGVED